MGNLWLCCVPRRGGVQYAFHGVFRLRVVYINTAIALVSAATLAMIHELEASGALDQQEPVALGWYKDEVVVVSQGVFTSTGMVMEDTPAGAATVKVIFPSGLNGRIPAVAVSRAA